MNTLPGQDTLTASWHALAHLSSRAHVHCLERMVAAVFPSWAALNNSILTGTPTIDLANQAAGEAAELYRSAGVPTWALWVPSGLTDLDSADTVPAIDLIRDTTTLVMTLSLASGSTAYHAGVVQTSIDAANLAARRPVPAGELPGPVNVPGLEGWVLVKQGVAVVGAWSYLHGTDCGIYAVGTVTEWRRQGLAAALMRHVLADAWDRGARTASLQSTRMGQSLYEQLGFTAVGRYEEWLHSPIAAPIV